MSDVNQLDERPTKHVAATTRATASGVDPEIREALRRQITRGFERAQTARRVVPTGGFWGFAGRLERGRFILHLAAINVAWVLIVGIVAVIGDDTLDSALPMVGFAVTVISAMQAVKRLRDLGRPASRYWLLLIPVYNLYLTCVLILRRGIHDVE